MNGLYHLKTDRGAGRGREGGRETEGGRGGGVKKKEQKAARRRRNRDRETETVHWMTEREDKESKRQREINNRDGDPGLRNEAV